MCVEHGRGDIVQVRKVGHPLPLPSHAHLPLDALQAIHTRRTGKSSLYAKIGGKKQVRGCYLSLLLAR